MIKKITTILTILFLLSFFHTNVWANWFLDDQGTLIYEDNGSVLGKKENTEASGQGPATNNPETGEKGEITRTETQERVQLKKQEREEMKNMIQIEREGLKIRVRTTNELSEELAPDETESGEFEIEEPKEKRTIKVRSTGKAFMVIRDKIGAQTNFPLMVNLDTNELIVTTPKGQKTVTILPDQAVSNMLAANVLDQLGGKGGLKWLEYQESLVTPSPEATTTATPTPEEQATSSATPTPEEVEATPSGFFPEEEESTEGGTIINGTTVDELITLTTTEDGTLAYEIPGFKFKKFLGFRKVKLERTALVSAETGELLTVKQSLATKLLDLLSN